MTTYYKMIGRKLNEVFNNEFDEYGMPFTIEDVEIEVEENAIYFTLDFTESEVYFRLDTHNDVLYINIHEDIYEKATLIEFYRELYYNKS